MKTPCRIATLAIALLMVVCAGGVFAQSVELEKITVSSGGNTQQSSPNFSARLTIGQTAAGFSQSAAHTAYIGFWQPMEAESEYLCGDANASGELDIDDIIYIIDWMFTGGPAPDPMDPADANCSGFVDMDDIVYLIDYIFTGGRAPCDVDNNGVPDC